MVCVMIVCVVALQHSSIVWPTIDRIASITMSVVDVSETHVHVHDGWMQMPPACVCCACLCACVVCACALCFGCFFCVARPTSQFAKYVALPIFDDCEALCGTLDRHPARDNKQLSCMVNMFNMFEKDEKVCNSCRRCLTAFMVTWLDYVCACCFCC
jgi:hypothetical protein